MSESNKPLLVITLQDEQSDPVVIYKGEEVKRKLNVSFEWETDTHVTMGGTTYSIEHAETGEEFPTINRIERRVKGHA